MILRMPGLWTKGKEANITGRSPLTIYTGCVYMKNLQSGEISNEKKQSVLGLKMGNDAT